jgi:hypothetical protein
VLGTGSFVVSALGFEQQRALALRILTDGGNLTRKAGSFLGQCAVDQSPLTDKQLDWLAALAERAGLSLEA